jgi:hypothetical protein
MAMPMGYVLGDIVTQSGLFFPGGSGIYLCRDDVVACSSSLSFQPSTAAAFSIAEPTASVPLNPVSRNLLGAA